MPSNRCPSESTVAAVTSPAEWSAPPDGSDDDRDRGEEVERKAVDASSHIVAAAPAPLPDLAPDDEERRGGAGLGSTGGSLRPLSAARDRSTLSRQAARARRQRVVVTRRAAAASAAMAGRRWDRSQNDHAEKHRSSSAARRNDAASLQMIRVFVRLRKRGKLSKHGEIRFRCAKDASMKEGRKEGINQSINRWVHHLYYLRMIVDWT